MTMRGAIQLNALVRQSTQACIWKYRGIMARERSEHIVKIGESGKKIEDVRSLRPEKSSMLSHERPS
jgi:hypothetical protein